jgi:hypothetical protein
MRKGSSMEERAPIHKRELGPNPFTIEDEEDEELEVNLYQHGDSHIPSGRKRVRQPQPPPSLTMTGNPYHSGAYGCDLIQL